MQVITLLQQAETQFEEKAGGKDITAQARTLEHQADLAYGNDEWKSAAELYAQLLGLEGIPIPAKALALLRRGYCHRQLGDSAKAIADYSAVIALPNAPTDAVANARAAIAEFEKRNETPPSLPRRRSPRKPQR